MVEDIFVGASIVLLDVLLVAKRGENNGPSFDALSRRRSRGAEGKRHTRMRDD